MVYAVMYGETHCGESRSSRDACLTRKRYQKWYRFCIVKNCSAKSQRRGNDFTSEPKKSSSMKDAADQYLSVKKIAFQAKPKEHYEYDQKSHAYEIEIGKWIIEKLGGKVELLRESGKAKNAGFNLRW